MQTITEIIGKEIISSPDFEEAVDKRAKKIYMEMSLEKRITYDQLAAMYQVSRGCVVQLTEEELARLGWKKLKVASAVRFERIEVTEASREAIKKAKKH